MVRQKPRSKNSDEILGEALVAEGDGVFSETGSSGISENRGEGGVGLPESVLEEENKIEDLERRELLVNPSDLMDVGDPEAGDAGVPGGFAAGGEMGEGGRGHTGSDPWGLDLIPAETLQYRAENEVEESDIIDGWRDER